MGKPAPGHSVRISEGLWAKAVIAGEKCSPRLTAGQYVEAAITEKLERHRDQLARAKEATPVRSTSTRKPPPLN